MHNTISVVWFEGEVVQTGDWVVFLRKDGNNTDCSKAPTRNVSAEDHGVPDHGGLVTIGYDGRRHVPLQLTGITDGIVDREWTMLGK